LSGGNSKRFGSEINKFDAFEPEAVCLTDERFGSIERYNAFGDGKCVVYHNRTYDIHPIFIYLTLYLLSATTHYIQVQNLFVVPTPLQQNQSAAEGV
jgi:hypothetical protein